MKLDVGLSIAYQLLRRNGAELGLEPDSGGGTVFRIQLAPAKG